MTNTKRNERTPPAKSLPGSDSRSAGRRFAPALNDVTDGGSVFGVLVANERAKQGLTQEELAKRIHTSPSTVARIEQGHPPGAELREQLTHTLYPDPPGGRVRRFAPSGAMRRAGTRAAPADRARLRFPRRSRWLWVGLAAAAVILIGVIVGSQISGTDSGPSGQPSVAVSDVLGAPAAIHGARLQAQKAAAAEARRAAEKAREREQAAAAAAAAAAARKAKKAANESAPAASEPVTEPVAPSPSPAPSPAPSGGGGGDSSGPAPGLQHGIGNGG
jgi:transcriptional regulator with XRE-family HTH domain